VTCRICQGTGYVGRTECGWCQSIDGNGLISSGNGDRLHQNGRDGVMVGKKKSCLRNDCRKKNEGRGLEVPTGAGDIPKKRTIGRSRQGGG